MKAIAVAAAALLVLSAAAPQGFAMGSDSSPPPRPASTAKKDFEDGKKAIQAAQYDRGIELMKKVVAQEPKNADAYNYLGFASRKKGDLRAAAGFYQTALKIEPNHKGALEYQGEMFLKLGRLDDAFKNRVKLRELCPKGCAELSELDRAIADFHASSPKT